MITTTYKCDRCGKEDTDYNKIQTEKVSIVCGQYKTPAHVTRPADWCLDCRVELGIVQPNHNKNITPADPAPTLEELVREIIREEIENERL